jgi:hypothetical protein
LAAFTLISLSTSAITREGGSHASRSFMFLFSLITVCAIGISYLLTINKAIFTLLISLILLESVFFFHDYWKHYRFYSESSWSQGMKDLIALSSKQANSPIVISPKNEHPLIFYLFYNRFDPKRFQDFFKTKTVFNSLNGKYNLDGNQIGDTNLFIAVPIDYKNTSGGSLPGAIYYLTKLETENSGILSIANIKSIIRLSSGTPLYYEIIY